MVKKNIIVYPKSSKVLQQLGENIKLARKRRKISTNMLAERAGITHVTLGKVENGYPNVSMGIYINVLMCLGLEQDLLHVAKDDELGRKLMDAELLQSNKK